MCVSKYIKSQILRQIKEEKGDEKLEFIFSHKGVESLIFDYRDGRAYLSCFNEEKGVYFDAIVNWIEENDEVKFEIKYIEHCSKEELLIYHLI